jgi:hypothetical protein
MTVRYCYLLVADPDPENGLLVSGRQLYLNYAEIEYGLEQAIFTPGTVIRHLRRDRQFQVRQDGPHQFLVAMQ